MTYAWPALDPTTFTDPLDGAFVAGPMARYLDGARAVRVPRSRPGAALRVALRTPVIAGPFGIEELTVAAPGASAQVFCSDEESGPVTDRVSFVPGRHDDLLTIEWALTGAVDQLKVEVFRAGRAAPLLRRVLVASPDRDLPDGFDWDGRLAPMEDDERQGATTTIDAPAEEFPDGFITPEFSPYKVKLTVGGAGTPGRAAAWAFVDVAVHSVKLSWGEADWIPTARAEPATDLPQARHADLRAFERDLLQRLSTAGAADEAAKRHELVLDVNAFSSKSAATGGAIPPDTDFKAALARWGHGPRIPLQAEVKLRRSNGQGVSAPAALGRVRVLWDWEEPAGPLWAAEVDAALAGGPPRAADLQPYAGPWKAQLQAARDYVARARTSPAGPPGSGACPGDYGGKRGPGAPPVFPPQPGADAPAPGTFPFQVEACKTRTWAATSAIKRDGPLAGRAGALFQPSRLAGDAFRVRAYASFGPELDVTKKLVPPADAPQDPPPADELEVPAARAAASGEFVVRRSIRVKYLQKNVAQPLDWEGIKQLYGLMSVHLEVEPAVAVDEARFAQVVREQADAMLADPKWVEQRNPLEIFLRYAIDPSPPPGGPGLATRTFDEFKAAYLDAFKRRVVCEVRAHKKSGTFRCQAVRGTGGLEGVLVDPGTVVRTLFGKEAYVLCDGTSFLSPAEHFSTTVEGGEAKVDAVRLLSFWGAPVIVEEDGPDDRTIVVRLRTNHAHRVKFSRGSTTVDKAQLQALEHFLAIHFLAIAGTDASQATLQATVSGRADRRAAVVALLTALGQAKEQAWTSVLQANFPTRVEKDYAGHLVLVTSILLERVLRAYTAEVARGWNGVALFHLDGKTSTDRVKVGGASYPEEADPLLGVAFVSTPAQFEVQGSNGAPILYKPLTAVAAHELGHALSLPHAPRRQEGATPPGDIDAAAHAPDSACIMNYDQDTAAFCGKCALRLAGWRGSKLP
ncbi:MAG: hypothetical protein KF878_20475 [Planctomycetes bacterium]|nr:hypothetical protein [Planctomycetota bacterium]